MVFLENWLGPISTYINFSEFLIEVVPNSSVLVYVSILLLLLLTLERSLAIQSIVLILKAPISVFVNLDHFFALLVDSLSKILDQQVPPHSLGLLNDVIDLSINLAFLVSFRKFLLVLVCNCKDFLGILDCFTC